MIRQERNFVSFIKLQDKSNKAKAKLRRAEIHVRFNNFYNLFVWVNREERIRERREGNRDGDKEQEKEYLLSCLCPGGTNSQELGQAKVRSFVCVSHVLTGAQILGLPSSTTFSGSIPGGWNREAARIQTSIHIGWQCCNWQINPLCHNNSYFNKIHLSLLKKWEMHFLGN